MSTHITFKEYLESKDRLREAVEQTPIQLVEYEVRKYCRLPIGTSKEEKELLSLKPKQTLVVEWHYDDIKNPQPTNVALNEEKFHPYWNGKKLEKWLIRNTKEKENG